MTDLDYTHIAVVVDRSGSMSGIRKDMIGGLDKFFDSQSGLPGTCLVDYAQFDTEYELVFEDRPVSEARAQLDPRGMTALLDAIGITVTNLGKKLAALDEDKRPGKVLVVVVTDGEENSSNEYDIAAVKELVNRQESDYAWTFVFLGANMDAVAVGESFGFKGANSLTYNTSNVEAASKSLAGYATTYRGGGTKGFTQEDRQNNS